MQEHFEKDTLPKNIRQIGHISTNEKIYIEDYVMTYIKQLSREPFENEKTLILIGYTKNIDGFSYTFISGLLEIDKIKSYTELLENEQISRITNQKEDFFEGQDIVGLGIISTYEWLKFNEDIHEYFGSGLVGNMVLIYDANHEEIVYKYNDHRFIRQKGYYIYYNRNEAMQNYMLCMKDGKSIEYGYATTEIIDRSVDEKIRSFTIPKNTVYTSKNIDYSKYKNLFEKQWSKKLKYGSIVATLIIVLAIGIVKVDTFEKITKEKASELINKTEDVMKNESQNALDVDTVVGEISTVEPKETIKPTDSNYNTITPEPTVTVSDKPKINKKAEKKVSSNKALQKNKKYYIVKKGDALVDISRKMYGTIKKVDYIKKANGIEDENKIYIGQKLLIP